jgi:hypothetical protein
LAGETEVLGKKSAPVCPPQIPHGLTWDRTRAAAMGSRRLTASAVARPKQSCNISSKTVQTGSLHKCSYRGARSRHRSLGIATSCGLGGPGSIPARARDFLHSVLTGSEAHPASYPIGTGISFPGIKGPGREADRAHPSSVEVKNGGTIPPLPSMSSWLFL